MVHSVCLLLFFRLCFRFVIIFILKKLRVIFLVCFLVYFSINVNTNAKFLLKRKKDNNHKAKIKPNYHAVLSPEISWKILHMPVDSFLGAMVG